MDGDMNIYLGADDAIRKFDVNGTILWSYAPRGQLAAAPALSDGCASGGRLSANVWTTSAPRRSRNCGQTGSSATARLSSALHSFSRISESATSSR